MRCLPLGRSLILALSIATFLAALWADRTRASRPPSRAERLAMVDALSRYFRSAGMRGRFLLVGPRVSTVSRDWGAATVRLAQAGAARVLFARGPRGWLVADIGTAQVGCDPRLRVPRDVLRDLGLRCS